MSRGRRLILNTVLLTGSALWMRTIGLVFQVYLSNRIGAAGIGLFQLIMSVSILFVTFACSGIKFTTTRLVSEELGCGYHDGATKSLHKCFIYSVTMGCIASLIMYICSEYIGTVWIGDSRTVLSVRILSISLPFLSISSVIGGYFVAVQRVIKSAVEQIIEQLIRICTIIISLALCPTGNLEFVCAAVIIGNVISEILSFLLLLALYILDRRKYRLYGGKSLNITSRMFRIAVPLALSAYARTALTTLEEILIPKGFKKSGISAENSLAVYGTIQGMVFPVISYASALFLSVAEMLIPELTDAQVKRNDRYIEKTVNKVLQYCFFLATGIACIMYAFADELAIALYNSPDVGTYIKMLSPLILIMYLDTVTDGMLKGLGQQLASMRYNIFDAIISVILIYTLLPKYSVTAYIIIIYFTEIFNFSLSINRLRKISKLHFDVKTLAMALICAFSSVNVSIFILRISGFNIDSAVLSSVIHILLSGIVYIILLRLFNCITRSEVKKFQRIVRGQ